MWCVGCPSRRRLSNRVMEFPRLTTKTPGKPYRFTYCAGAAVKDDVKWGPNQCLIKFDTEPKVGVKSDEEVYYFGERTFLQEPIFAAKPGGNDEDDGYVP